MFGVLFGWRKASKCNKVIKEAQCRLKLLKKKRHSIVKHLREDTANLIKFGHENIALDRAEQLIKDESVAVAYELIDNFCDFVRTHFSHIRRHKDCPDDINEAVSSLIYASARCGDLPELRAIRNLFEERYGRKFAMAAVELFPGNLVNQQIKEALNMRFVSDDMKHRMINEIATYYCLQRQLLALEYYQKGKQEVKESNYHCQVLVTEERITNAETEGRVILADSSQGNKMAGDKRRRDLSSLSGPRNTAVLDSKEETVVESSSSESLPRFYEELLLVYLDDIAEFPSAKDEDSQDQRVFKFKTPVLSKRLSFQTSSDRRIDARKYDSWDENSSSNGSQRSPGMSRKRTRRRLVCAENQGIEDMDCTRYYAQPRKYRSSKQRKQQKKSQEEEESQRSFCSRKIGVTPLASNLQCYPNKSCRNDEGNACESRHCREQVSSKPTRRSFDGQICRQSSDVKGKVPPYSRAKTMPLGRSKDVAKDEFQRSNSCPAQEHPNHVHPKLPDYDDLTARFLAMKKEFLLNNKANRRNRQH